MNVDWMELAMAFMMVCLGLCAIAITASLVLVLTGVIK